MSSSKKETVQQVKIDLEKRIAKASKEYPISKEEILLTIFNNLLGKKNLIHL
jgi:hypothetical protein